MFILTSVIAAEVERLVDPSLRSETQDGLLEELGLDASFGEIVRVRLFGSIYRDVPAKTPEFIPGMKPVLNLNMVQ